jgi:hypothetical protein
MRLTSATSSNCSRAGHSFYGALLCAVNDLFTRRVRGVFDQAFEVRRQKELPRF